MSRKLLAFVALAIVSGLMTGMVSDAAAQHELIGAPKCKMCHKSKTGDQWGIWEGSKHAQAFVTLGSEESKKIAAEMGLGDPQKEEACLKCHATQAFLGRDVPLDKRGKYEDAEGVGCEACHGAGSLYKSMKVMKDLEQATANGLLAVTEETCVKCHNENSPTFKGFDYAARSAEVAHPYPAAE
jgi:hypothetical protein